MFGRIYKGFYLVVLAVSVTVLVIVLFNWAEKDYYDRMREELCFPEGG